MANRSMMAGAGWLVAGLLGGYFIFDRMHSPPSPTPTPAAVATPEPLAIVEPPVSTPETPVTFADVPSDATPEPVAVVPVAEPTARVPEAATVQPTADPTEAMRAEREQRIRYDIAAAKARAESLEAAVKTECPDLKPGDLRLPEAVNQCVRLRSEAAQAATYYEILKRQALAAGILVQ